MTTRYLKNTPMSNRETGKSKRSLLRLFRFLFYRLAHPQARTADEFPITYYKKGKCSRRKLLATLADEQA